MELIGSVGAGYDFVDAEAATRNKQWVTNTPGVVDDATADATILLMLSTMRHQYEIEYNMRHGLPNKPRIGRDPTGMILGIVGMGGIGKVTNNQPRERERETENRTPFFFLITKHNMSMNAHLSMLLSFVSLFLFLRLLKKTWNKKAVAKRAQSLGMKVVYHNRRPISADAADSTFLNTVEYLATLDELLAVSDVVSIHVPLSAETRHLIGAAEFAKMKEGAYFLNTSRGPVVHEESLVQALESGHIAGAGLDVFEHEPKVHPSLLSSMNVALMPHLGAFTIETITKMEALTMENIDLYLSSGSLLTPVNSVN